MTAELVKKWLIPKLISGNLAIWTVLASDKVVLYCFWVPREINSRFCSKSQWQMFLLVSWRHVGTHLDGHQHGASIQISIYLGKKKYPHISLTKNSKWPESWRESLFIYFRSFSRFWALSVERFWLILIWRDTENQQYVYKASRTHKSRYASVCLSSSLFKQ